MRRHSQSGAITLEACISVLTFVILTLFLSSFFTMFMAQNMTAHAVLQTTQSLSLDVYTIQSLVKEDDGKIGSISDNVANLLVKLFGSAEDNPYFVSDSYWHEGESDEIQQVIKTRFIGYLSGGDEDKADELLQNLNVSKGLDGLDFSESYIEDDVLNVVLKYELEYNFNIWGVDALAVEQKACSKLWK